MPVSRCGNVIAIRDGGPGAPEGRFDATTGARLSGNLEMAPDEVLFRAWAQTQNPKYNESELRRLWAARK